MVGLCDRSSKPLAVCHYLSDMQGLPWLAWLLKPAVCLQTRTSEHCLKCSNGDRLRLQACIRDVLGVPGVSSRGHHSLWYCRCSGSTLFFCPMLS